MIKAAKLYGCRAIGIEIEAERAQAAKDSVRAENLEVGRADCIVYIMSGVHSTWLPSIEEMRSSSRGFMKPLLSFSSSLTVA